jgi:hypothetical protein
VFRPWEQVVDAVEFKGITLAAARADPRHFASCLPGHAAWAREAAGTYLDAAVREQRRREAAGLPRILPVRAEWVAIRQVKDDAGKRRADTRGVDQYERRAWGRRYATADRSERELWIPSLTRAPATRPLSELVAAAAVLAFGAPTETSPYHARWTPDPHEPAPQRVRVLGIGLGDGALAVLRDEESGLIAADWSAAEVRQLFAEHVGPRIAVALDGRERRANPGCADCVHLAGCPTIPRASRLLGVPAPRPARKRRTVSMTDLRAFHDCPARYYLTRVLNLRETAPENPENLAIRRGRAVDAWLNARHADPDRVPCRRVVLPDRLPGLAAEESAPALDMIRRHRGNCPLDRIGTDEDCTPQRQVTVLDTAADVVVVASCDLVHTERGGVVVRETKTSVRGLYRGADPLERYPQLALAVLLVRSGALGGEIRRSRVELELLRPDGVAEEEFAPDDPATVERARAALAAYTEPWARAQEYPEAPREGFDCAECEARRWCATGLARSAGNSAPQEGTS